MNYEHCFSKSSAKSFSIKWMKTHNGCNSYHFINISKKFMNIIKKENVFFFFPEMALKNFFDQDF